MRPPARWLAGLLLLGCVVALGCQTWFVSTTLPSGQNVEKPPQYFAPPQPIAIQKELAYQDRVWRVPAPATRIPDPAAIYTGPPLAGAPCVSGVGTKVGVQLPPRNNPVQIDRDQLDEFALKEDGLTINNFCVNELGVSGGWGTLRLCGSYRNRTPEVRSIFVMIAGLDESKELLWACNIVGDANPDSVGTLPSIQVPVPAGTWKRTTRLSLRLYTCEGTNLVPARSSVGTGADSR
jgi:hypothetical protein